MTVETLTEARAVEVALDYDAVARINRWLLRGDGMAVYQNHDMCSHDRGSIVVVSYGSPEAQLETDTPPTTLPDFPGSINWRYQLIALYRGEPLRVEEGGTR